MYLYIHNVRAKSLLDIVEGGTTVGENVIRVWLIKPLQPPMPHHLELFVTTLKLPFSLLSAQSLFFWQCNTAGVHLKIGRIQMLFASLSALALD